MVSINRAIDPMVFCASSIYIYIAFIASKAYSFSCSIFLRQENCLRRFKVLLCLLACRLKVSLFTPIFTNLVYQTLELHGTLLDQIKYVAGEYVRRCVTNILKFKFIETRNGITSYAYSQKLQRNIHKQNNAQCSSNLLQ